MLKGYEDLKKREHYDQWQQARLIASTIANMAGRQLKKPMRPEKWLPLRGDVQILIKLPTKEEVMKNCSKLLN